MAAQSVQSETPDAARSQPHSDSPSHGGPSLPAPLRTTESVESETPDTAGEKTADSDPSDGPPLPPRPPRTLRSYPVYKPANIRRRGDAEERWRPLSYRWLVGRCAEHIHVRRSAVERYVDRLELMHVVPADPRDYRDRMLRSNLIRRCFTPLATRQQSTRRSRKSRPKLPPKKLL